MLLIASSSASAAINLAAGSHKQTPLHLAVAIDDEHWLEAGIPVVRALLKAGANPDAQDEYRRTALHYAVERGRWDAVQVLIAANANANLADVEGETPLHWASKHSYVSHELLHTSACALSRGGTVALAHSRND